MINRKHVLYFHLDSDTDNKSVVRKMLLKCNQTIQIRLNIGLSQFVMGGWACSVCTSQTSFEVCTEKFRTANNGLKHN